MSTLEKGYSQAFALLQALFGDERVRASIERLNEIHHRTEAIWEDYVRTLPGGVVRFLLIAEAPPWSVDGVPQYVLDPNSRPRTLMRALRRAFDLSRGLSASETLAELARRGFLVVDSIPFSMDYSKKRSSPKYQQLIDVTAKAYLKRKLSHSSLSWHREVRVAFCFKRNGEAVISALNGRLMLGRFKRAVDVTAIAANGAGYPDASLLVRARRESAATLCALAPRMKRRRAAAQPER